MPEPEQQTDIYISVAPIRKLDLVFMIDNSPSMAPKVEKMNKQFEKLIAALKDPSDGQYPDLRVALINSDLGTGGAYSSGSCGPNDSNGQNAYGDVGHFQMRGASGCGMTSGDALWIEYTKGAPVNFQGPSDNINKVFGCLATNLGTVGCGMEHQLQAYEFALIAQNLHAGGAYAKQNEFLRPEAYLGLVFLSDEDDCSAATNDGMMGDKPELRGESASLRCATRGHVCKGMNLSDTGPGYPTTQAFQTAFTDCSPRMDSCPNTTDGAKDGTDTSVPTSCSPLKSIKNLANGIKGLKGDQASEKILVAGIFGWPLADGEGNPDLSTAEPYKIDKVPNPNSADTAHPEVWDYWPVCYDPDHKPKTKGAFDQEAWGWGAEGGLRLSAFVDEFGEQNGLKYSICEKDFTKAMQGIGTAIAKKLQNLCVDEKLYNTKFLSTPNPANPDELGSDCRVVFRNPVVDEKTKRITYQEDPKSMPKCAPGSKNGQVSEHCWTVTIDHKKCETNGQLIQIMRTADEIRDNPTLPEGTKVGMQCRTCPDASTVEGLDPQSETFRACSYAAFK